MMALADIFVGLVSITLGAVAIVVGALRLEWALRLPKIQSLHRQWGERGTRVFFALLGAALIAAGCAVMAGFAPGWLG